MSSAAARVVELARGEVGVKESPAGSNRVKYWDYYREHAGVNYQGQPWCAAFTAWVLCRAGVWAMAKDEGRFRYCPSIVAWAKAQGAWKGRSAAPQPGWLVLFANKGTACHVGIVEACSGGKLTTIEGNTSVTSNDNGGAVMRRNRTLGTEGSSWYVLGYAAVAGGSSSGSKPAQGTVDEVAAEVVAGKWGVGTEREERLKAAGYDAAEVQAEVNRLMGQGAQASPPVTPAAKYACRAYRLTADRLRVRTGPGTGYRAKARSELTANGRANAYDDGTLKRGTPVDVSEVRQAGTDWWGLIPSGWIALEYRGKAYVQ